MDANFSLKGFASAFSRIENELESAVKDKDFDASVSEYEPGTISPVTPSVDAVASKASHAGATADPVAATGVEHVSGPVALEAAEMKELSNRLNAALAQTTKLEVRLKEKTELCVEKDAQIAAVLEEGEQLSIRQAEQERQIRTLRQRCSTTAPSCTWPRRRSAGGRCCARGQSLSRTSAPSLQSS